MINAEHLLITLTASSTLHPTLSFFKFFLNQKFQMWNTKDNLKFMQYECFSL